MRKKTASRIFLIFSMSLCLMISPLIMSFSTASAQSRADTQWPTFQGNAGHTGLSPYNTSENSGGLKWCVNLSESIESSPVISSDGTIYITTDPGGLYAIDINGTIKWNYSPNGSSSTTPVIDSSGNIYFTSGSHFFGKYHNSLYSISPDGSENWNFNVNSSLLSPMVDTSSNIYVASSDGIFYSINPDGSERWNITVSGYSSFCTPAIADDGTIYYSTSDTNNSGNLYAFSPSGIIKWNYTTGNINNSPTIDKGNKIYIASIDGKIFCIDPNGFLVWENELFDTSVWSSPAIGSDGTIFVGITQNQDKILALNPTNGQIIWTSERIIDSNFGLNTSPAIGSDGTIYFQTNSAKLFAFDNNGNFKWYFTPPYLDNSFQAEISSPAIGNDGTIYYGGSDGYLYAVWGHDGAPVANFTAYYPIDNSSKLFYFDASESYDNEDDIDNLTFRWSFGDNSTGKGCLLNHTYKNIGNYLVTLTVTDCTGKSDSTTTNLTVADNVIIPPVNPEFNLNYLLALFCLFNLLPFSVVIFRGSRGTEPPTNARRRSEIAHFKKWLKLRFTPIAWLGSLMIADVVTTYIALSRRLGFENNPIARVMLEFSNGYFIVLILKFLAMIVITFVAFRIYRGGMRRTNKDDTSSAHHEIPLWAFTIGTMVFTVGNNLLIISQ